MVTKQCAIWFLGGRTQAHIHASATVSADRDLVWTDVRAYSAQARLDLQKSFHIFFFPPLLNCFSELCCSSGSRQKSDKNTSTSSCVISHDIWVYQACPKHNWPVHHEICNRTDLFLLFLLCEKNEKSKNPNSIFLPFADFICSRSQTVLRIETFIDYDQHKCPTICIRVIRNFKILRCIRNIAHHDRFYLRTWIFISLID